MRKVIWGIFIFLFLVIGFPQNDGMVCSILSKEIVKADDTIVVSGKCGENVQYQLIKNDEDSYTLNIFGEGAMYDYYAWENFIEIFDRLKIKTLNIGDGITHIGDNSFHQLNKIEEVLLPDSVKSIGEGAFGCCNKLKKINIPQNVSNIERDAFYSCTSLENVIVASGNINYDSGNNNDLLIEKSTKTLLHGCKSSSIPEDIEIIGRAAFYWRTDLISISIPKNVKRIEDSAFHNCINLQYVEMCTGLEVLDNNSFSGCKSLRSVVIPSSVEIIGSEAFSGCINLENVEISEGVKKIRPKAFYDCKKLNSIFLPESIKFFGTESFGYGYYIDSNSECVDMIFSDFVIYSENEEALKYAQENGFNIITNHRHPLKKVDAVSPTCSQEGNIEYYECEECNKYYSDLPGLNRISLIDTIKSRLQHQYTNYVYNNDATCYKDGTKTAYCDFGCGATDKKTISNSKVPHTYSNSFFNWSEDGRTCEVMFSCTKVGCTDANEGHNVSYATTVTKSVKVVATCTTPGVTTYTASYGGYSDTKDVTDIPIDPSNHGQVIVKNAMQPTCLTEGYTGDIYCSCCNKLISQGTVIAKTSHITIVKNVIPSTCSTEGYTGDTYCSCCNKLISQGTVIAKISHITIVKNAIAPTCSAEGYTGDTYCSCCNKLISQGTVIAKTSHATIVKNKKAATYFEKGYTGDNVCTLCGEVVAKGKAISVKKLSKVNLSSVKSKKTKQVSLNWKKNKYATGYEIQYSTDKNFIKGVKTIRISKNTTLSYKLKKLTSKKTVYFKISAYKTGKVNKKSKTVYSAWSAVKNVKVK